jgi:LCP family protein required for cell wall assembly
VPDDSSTSPVPVDQIRHLADGPTHNRTRVGIVWASRVISVGVAVALLVVIGYYSRTLRNINNEVPHLNIQVGQTPTTHTGPAPGQTDLPRQAPSEPDIDGKDQNILVVGNDDRSNMTNQEVRELHVGRDGGSLNTDTMMILHVPADGSSATLISLPRDTYVAIPGYGKNRLNSAYAFGYLHASGDTNAKRIAGANLLIKTVTNLTGLTIDHFVQVSLLGFFRIAKAIGGVPVTLCNAIDGRPYTNLVLSAGKHTLNPVQALEFVRQRHGLNMGDLDRVARQRYFITAAFRQITSAGVLLNPGKLNALVNAVKNSIWVDENFDLLKFAGQIGDLSANNIVGRTIPYVAGIVVNGLGEVIQVDPAQVRRFVAGLVDGSDVALANATLVSPSSVTVAVRGSTGVPGAVGKAFRTLKRVGFHATKGDSIGRKLANTTLEYAPGMESQAKTLARYVKGAQLYQVSDLPTLTLVMGSDGTSVTRTPSHHHVRHHKPIDAGCTP